MTYTIREFRSGIKFEYKIGIAGKLYAYMYKESDPGFLNSGYRAKLFNVALTDYMDTGGCFKYTDFCIYKNEKLICRVTLANQFVNVDIANAIINAIILRNHLGLDHPKVIHSHFNLRKPTADINIQKQSHEFLNEIKHEWEKS